MIEEKGRVVAVKGHEAWVEIIRSSACDGCSQEEGCGQGVLARWADRRRTHIKITTERSLQLNDQVVMGITEQALLQGSLLTYGLPLLGMLLGAFIGHSLGASELWTIICSVLGLCAGLLTARWGAQVGPAERFHPQLLRVLGQSQAEPALTTPSSS